MGVLEVLRSDLLGSLIQAVSLPVVRVSALLSLLVVEGRCWLEDLCLVEQAQRWDRRRRDRRFALVAERALRMLCLCLMLVVRPIARSSPSLGRRSEAVAVSGPSTCLS